MKPVARAIRTLQRIAPAVVGAVTAGAIASGGFSDLRKLGLGHGLLLLLLLATLVVLGARRVRQAVRELPTPPREEAELGGLLVVACHAVVQPAGGIDSPLYPLLYLLMAFLVAFLPVGLGLGLTVFAALLEVLLFAVGGLLPERWPTLAGHVVFLFVFAGLYQAVYRAQRITGALALQVERRMVAERARQYRLGLDADADQKVDEQLWTTAAVKEVEEAVGNALEVAEVALRSHTVAVFLLTPDDKHLVLHDCRSQSDDVLRSPFDAHEGILGAVLKRRMPLRLCGEIKHANWYERRKELRAVVAVPLVERRGAGGDGFIRGIIVADRLEQEPFGEDDEKLLVATSREVLRAIDVERVMGYIRRTRDEKEQVFTAIEELNRCSKIDEVIGTTLALVRRIVPLELAAFTTIETDADGKKIHKIERAEGKDRFLELQGLSFPDNNGLVANALRFDTILPGRELKLFERLQIFDSAHLIRGLQSLRIVPVTVGEEKIGTLVCGSTRRRALDGDAVRMLRVVALQAGQAFLRARLFAQTERMATTDGLTGLLNHRTFQARFDEELARAARSGRKVALILTDIDHFKSINDTYGHATGDEVLRGVARIVQRCARTTDVVARYGGEEFALVLPETDMAGGKVIAERIRKAVEAHTFNTELGPLKVTLSLGIAAYPDVSQVKEELFEKTDQCLYHCKRTGRNRSTTVDEMRRAEAIALG